MSASANTIRPEPTKVAKRETWRDWWPNEPADPDQLLTRQELVDHARAEGIDVSVLDISNWQRLGAIPAGMLRQVGPVREALYPKRFIDVLRDLRTYQAEGTKLTRIGPLLRMKHAGPSRVFRSTSAQATGSAGVSTFTASARAHVRRGDPTLTANDVLAQTLRNVARAHEATFGGRRIVEVRLTLVDEAGDELALSIDTD